MSEHSSSPSTNTTCQRTVSICMKDKVREKRKEGNEMYQSQLTKRQAMQNLQKMENRVKRMQQEEANARKAIADARRKEAVFKEIKRKTDEDRQKLHQWKEEEKLRTEKFRLQFNEERQHRRQKISNSRRNWVNRNKAMSQDVKKTRQQNELSFQAYLTNDLQNNQKRKNNRSFESTINREQLARQATMRQSAAKELYNSKRIQNLRLSEDLGRKLEDLSVEEERIREKLAQRYKQQQALAGKFNGMAQYIIPRQVLTPTPMLGKISNFT